MQKEHILKQNQDLAKAGLRVLAFGYKEYNHENLTLENENHLTFIGLIFLMDQTRIESLEDVIHCKKAATSIAKKLAYLKKMIYV